MTAIYHITHADNLGGILAEGGLHCDNQVGEHGLARQGLGHAHIKERRAATVVPIGPRGTLASYVPFYFAPRSPMLYAIHKGYVAGYTGGQEQVLHLVGRVETIAERGLGFVFTDGHAVLKLSRFFEDLARLSEIDWSIMRGTYWNDTQEDPDRKRRRQAEFLVHRFVPWECVTEIGVMAEAMRKRVREVVSRASHVPKVAVHRDWYY